MKILYVATDQQVPGHVGGSVHVASVARELVELGHDVKVLVSPGDGLFPDDGAVWTAMVPPLGVRQLRWLQTARVTAVAEQFQPDVVIERYYNFGGEGVQAARRINAVSVLEVNAPVVDYPGSRKRMVDRALLIEPMRRWRDWQCRRADLIVTPRREIVPPWVPAERIVELEWGADTTRFTPAAVGGVPFARTPSDTVAVFAGAFRSWHGAVQLVEAVRHLREQGLRQFKAVFVGKGPELSRVQQAASETDGIQCLGQIPHNAMPACLAAADIGVAPFDVDAHAPLSLGFYWSPLKIFEYMAAGLPVVAPDIAHLRSLVRHERDGLLYDANDPEGLIKALGRLSDQKERVQLGQSARSRVVEHFGWRAHCEQLTLAINRVRQHRGVSDE